MEHIRNPLEEYYQDSGMSWDQIAVIAEVSQPQLIRISKKNQEELTDIKLSTAISILTHLGVDLFSYVYPEIIQVLNRHNYGDKE